MVNRRISATPSTDLPRLGGSRELRVIPGREPERSNIPNVKALNEISAKISTLAQEIMKVTFQRPEATTLVQASDLLAEAGSELTAIDRLSTADQRVRVSLDGARTALLTAVRELREHLIRHGWMVDDIAHWQAPATGRPGPGTTHS